MVLLTARHAALPTFVSAFGIHLWHYDLILFICLTHLLLTVQGLSITGAAMATMELARVDASCATFYLVHTFLAMLTIALMVRSSRAAAAAALTQEQLQQCCM
jgi:hypothetical protein